MLKKLYVSTFLSLLVVSSYLRAEVVYEILDIGTLQTKSSEAIALNNKGQILGWYNIDGTNEGKHFFVRNKDGAFYELPGKEPASGLVINWQYLTDTGKAYGIFAENILTNALCLWDERNGVVKLGVLPGKEISAINNAGQVLIQSVVENENGKTICRPVIWDNGKITKLNGLEGNAGLISEESYGFDMNNKGEVVGKSLTNLVYKNKIYKQFHATKWVNGQAIDLHKKIPKTNNTNAIAINDNEDILIRAGPWELYIYEKNGVLHNIPDWFQKINNTYMSGSFNLVMEKKEKNGQPVMSIVAINSKITNDLDSIWMQVTKITCVNDNGEIVARGETIFGEQHAIFLVPVKSN